MPLIASVSSGRNGLSLFGAVFLLIAGFGCNGSLTSIECFRERDQLKQSVGALERSLAEREARIVTLEGQVQNLTTFGPDRPADAFSPVRIEIANLSGGADYDGKSGDDGITIYLRLRDVDGDLVKAPGQIRIQLLDDSDSASPKSMGTYQFTKLEEVRGLWYGRFGTYEYALKCPLPENSSWPKSGQLVATAEFVDYLTGRSLVATKRVGFKSAAREGR